MLVLNAIIIVVSIIVVIFNNLCKWRRFRLPLSSTFLLFSSFLFLWTLESMIGNIFGTWNAITQLLKTAAVSKFGLPLIRIVSFLRSGQIPVIWKSAWCFWKLNRDSVWTTRLFGWTTLSLPDVRMRIIICTLGDQSRENSWESNSAGKSQMGKEEMFRIPYRWYSVDSWADSKTMT